jgi:hypothetical protein
MGKEWAAPSTVSQALADIAPATVALTEAGSPLILPEPVPLSIPNTELDINTGFGKVELLETVLENMRRAGLSPVAPSAGIGNKAPIVNPFGLSLPKGGERYRKDGKPAVNEILFDRLSAPGSKLVESGLLNEGDLMASVYGRRGADTVFDTSMNRFIPDEIRQYTNLYDTIQSDKYRQGLAAQAIKGMKLQGYGL